MGRATRGFMEFVSGLLAGVVLGYAAALLLAPAEGKEARTRLHDGADALRERPRQVADDVQARVLRAVEQGRQAASEARSELERSAGLASPELKSDAGDHSATI